MLKTRRPATEGAGSAHSVSRGSMPPVASGSTEVSPILCSACGAENRPDHKFCAECGPSLAPVCPSCGVESPAGARFCPSCGSALGAGTSEDTAERAELFTDHTGWGGGKRNAATIALVPLSDGDMATLLTAMPPRSVVPAEARQAILERRGGNPPYAAEFVRYAADRDMIDDLSTRDGCSIDLPCTDRAAPKSRSPRSARRCPVPSVRHRDQRLSLAPLRRTRSTRAPR